MSTLVDIAPPEVKRRARRLRVLSLLALVAAAGTLAAAAVYALTTLNGSGNGSATTGSVTLGTPVSALCNYTSLAPGDLTGSGTCSLGVTYTGSLSAYMSLTVVIEAKAAGGAGHSKLYDGSNSTGLTLSISDGTNSYTVPTGTGTTGSPCPAGFTCWTASNDLAAWYSPANLTFINGKAVTWTVTPKFLKTVGNSYQGGTALVLMTATAVQTGANPLPATCTTSTIGKPCSGAGFSWS